MFSAFPSVVNLWEFQPKLVVTVSVRLPEEHRSNLQVVIYRLLFQRGWPGEAFLRRKLRLECRDT